MVRYTKHKNKETIKEYERLLVSQGYECAVCGDSPVDQVHEEVTLVIDHDHTTKEIRGLLCHHCNSGIGYFLDDPDLLRRAADYLE